MNECAIFHCPQKLRKAQSSVFMLLLISKLLQENPLLQYCANVVTFNVIFKSLSQDTFSFRENCLCKLNFLKLLYLQLISCLDFDIIVFLSRKWNSPGHVLDRFSRLVNNQVFVCVCEHIFGHMQLACLNWRTQILRKTLKSLTFAFANDKTILSTSWSSFLIFCGVDWGLACVLSQKSVQKTPFYPTYTPTASQKNGFRRFCSNMSYSSLICFALTFLVFVASIEVLIVI